MTTPAKRCKECGSETTVTTLGSFSGREGPVTVTVDDMPAVVCSRNHKRFVYAEFASMLVDLVSDPGRIAAQPPAVKRGLLKKRYYCSACEAELPGDSSKAAERPLDAHLPKTEPFKVVMRVALYACDRCGREHVRPKDELAESAMKALAHGFRAVDVHPDR